MRRIVILIVIGALAALAVLYGIRLAERSTSRAVSALLPRDTVAFVHLPDFNRTRDQWHQSDVYQLYSEPSVQEFLRKPLAKLAPKGASAQALQEIERLDPKDAFVAITRIDNNNPTVTGGFRFKCSQAEAEKIIERWRARVLTQNRAAQREKLAYERHQIDTITVAPFVLATAFADDWFFAANDVNELKAMLYRADHRDQDRQSALEGDKNFRAAMAHLPAGYAVAFYVQPKTFSEKLAWLRSANGRNVPPDQRTMIEQIRGMSGASRFERGKIHDIFFVAMPKLEDTKLTRSSLALGTKNTFLYLAMLMNLGQKLDAFNQTAGSGTLAAGWQKTLQTFARSGVTAEDWKAAFGIELGALADWPESARGPWLFVTFPVQDTVKAGRVIEMLTASPTDGTSWNQTEKDGVRYYSMMSAASLLAITPTIALSNRLMVIGLDPISVEQAIKRGESGGSELADSAAYDNAAKPVPAPTNFFAYVDVPILYSRIDSTVRPMLLLGAAFLPWLNDYVDLAKLPPAEVVTKHLGPIVSSQRYDGDGYVAESVGSITLNQSGLGLGALGIWGTMAYQRGGGPSLKSPITSSPPPAASPSPTGTKGRNPLGTAPTPRASGTP